MFAIIIYDVNSKKDPKILKILRKYCYHEQLSVFEGELTQTQLNKLIEELRILLMMKINKDIYSTFNKKYFYY